jgi:nucleoside-diphosphate-sugar epimerase
MQKHEVVCLVRDRGRGSGLEGLGAQPMIGDLNDGESLRYAIKGCSTIYHLAGVTSTMDPNDFYTVNELGTRRLVSIAANQPNPPTFLYVSSLAAAGPALNGQPKNENESCSPASHYGCSKLAAEVSVAQFAAKMPITIVRPPIVLGPGDHASVILFKTLKKFRVHMIPSDRNRLYSLIDARDLVRGLQLAAENGERLPDWTGKPNPQVFPHNDSEPSEPSCDVRGQGVYFIAADEHWTFTELGRQIAGAMDVKKYVNIPATNWTMKQLAAISEKWATLHKWNSATFNRDKAREATAGPWCCSNEKSRSQLGFAPEKPMVDRIRETAEWYLKKGWV